MNEDPSSVIDPIATARQLTPSGRGGVAVLQVVGNSQVFDTAPPLFVAVNGREVASQRLNRLCFGHWGEVDREEVLVCRTSPDETEIHCHGGSAAIARILGDLKARGVNITTPQTADEERSIRGLSLIEAECRAALIAASTRRSAAYLLTAADRLHRSLQPLLTALTQAPECTPDFAVERLDEILRWSAFGLHLVAPWSIVIAGRPNVGKSTLMNALLGYSRSIVYDQPGTTRDVVTALSAIDGWPVEFADTAGIRDTTEEIESDGIRRAWGRLATGDVTILLIDSSQPPTLEDRLLLSRFPDALLIAHKADLPSQWGEPLPTHSIAVSSLNGAGVEELIQRIAARLVPELPTESTSFSVSLRLDQHLNDLRQLFVENKLPKATSVLRLLLDTAAPAAV